MKKYFLILFILFFSCNDLIIKREINHFNLGGNEKKEISLKDQLLEHIRFLGNLLLIDIETKLCQGNKLKFIFEKLEDVISANGYFFKEGETYYLEKKIPYSSTRFVELICLFTNGLQKIIEDIKKGENFGFLSSVDGFGENLISLLEFSFGGLLVTQLLDDVDDIGNNWSYLEKNPNIEKEEIILKNKYFLDHLDQFRCFISGEIGLKEYLSLEEKYFSKMIEYASFEGFISKILGNSSNEVLILDKPSKEVLDMYVMPWSFYLKQYIKKIQSLNKSISDQEIESYIRKISTSGVFKELIEKIFEILKIDYNDENIKDFEKANKTIKEIILGYNPNSHIKIVDYKQFNYKQYLPGITGNINYDQFNYRRYLCGVLEKEMVEKSLNVQFIKEIEYLIDLLNKWIAERLVEENVIKDSLEKKRSLSTYQNALKKKRQNQEK
jgi:hypothetical protein